MFLSRILVKYEFRISWPSNQSFQGQLTYINKCFLHRYSFSFFKFIYFLFLAAFCLHRCMRAFSLWRAGATLRCGARASHCIGFSCCGAQALGVWASIVVARGFSSCGSRALELRLSSCGTWALVALWHVGSSTTRAWTRVPCIGRQIFNHCATSEALFLTLEIPDSYPFLLCSDSI